MTFYILLNNFNAHFNEVVKENWSHICRFLARFGALSDLKISLEKL